jgi:hypothetical protein
MKTRLFALALAAVMTAAAAPAFASSCPKHMAAIDKALAGNPSVSPDVLVKVKGLRAKGEAMHKAGKHAESMEALTEAEKMLGIGGH